MDISELIQSSIISALTDSLIDKPREVRILQVITWVGAGIALWGCDGVLRNPIFTGILLIAVLASIVMLHRRANELVNELTNDITPINELLISPGNIVETIKRLEGRNIIDDISIIIKKGKGIKKLLQYSPIPLLPILTALFIAFSVVFAMDTILHPFISVNSHDAITAGLGIMVLAILALLMINLTVKTTGITDQGSATNQGINYMGAHALDIVNEYFNPTKAKSILSHLYKTVYYVLSFFPKLKLSINAPKPYLKIYVSNNRLCDELTNFVKNHLNEDNEKKLGKLREILGCEDGKGRSMSGLKDLLEIESPYELLSLDNPNSSELLQLRSADGKRMTVLIKAWKGCTHVVRDIVRNVDPRFDRVRIKCRRGRVITVFAVGHEELLGELDLILNLYGKPPNYG
ncbi:hypothetical protein [Vulcanisaeta sp. JCM 14467]